MSAPARRQTHEGLAATSGQRLQVGPGDHSGIPREEATGELPATKVFLDLGHRGDVYRVAGEYPVTHRKSVAGDRQTDHDLWCVATAVLAVTSFPGGSIGLLARRRAALNLAVLVAFVFLVGLEVHRGRVVEDHLN